MTALSEEEDWVPLRFGWPGSQYGQRQEVQGAWGRALEPALSDDGEARLHVDRSGHDSRGSGGRRGDDLVRVLRAVFRVAVFALGLGLVMRGVVVSRPVFLVAFPHRVITRNVREDNPGGCLAGERGEQEDGRG